MKKHDARTSAKRLKISCLSRAISDSAVNDVDAEEAVESSLSKRFRVITGGEDDGVSSSCGVGERCRGAML
jgi:hypothetical protein